MIKPDVNGARQFALSYLKSIKPRWEELAGRDSVLTYSVELLREHMGMLATAGEIKVDYSAADWLVKSATTCPYAYQLYEELCAIESQLTGPGADTIRYARLKKPKAQGNREQNGVRDLILSLMWKELQEFGLPNENRIRKGVRPTTASIGLIISESIQQVVGLKIEPRTIMAAVFNRQKN